jgi:hypothetical protein
VGIMWKDGPGATGRFRSPIPEGFVVRRRNRNDAQHDDG